MANKIEVSWSGRYPALCSGEWKIVFNGISLKIPKEKARSNMGTFGFYCSIDMNEVQDGVYEDGLEFREWLEENYFWIYEMFKDADLLDVVEFSDLENLYKLIQASDWRKLSCGGCL